MTLKEFLASDFFKMLNGAAQDYFIPYVKNLISEQLSGAGADLTTEEAREQSSHFPPPATPLDPVEQVVNDEFS